MLQRSSEKKRPCIAIVAGMPRAGTTTLYHNLQEHPQAFVPFRKETHYFSFNHARGITWYLELFHEVGPDQVGFDICPTYFLCSQALERILQFDSDVKVILSVRDPVEWALSFYTQVSSYSLRVPCFREFLQGYLFHFGDKAVQLELHNSFVTGIIQRYRDTFDDNLLLFDFGLFRRDRLSVLRAIERFVGISHYFEPGNFDEVIFNASNRRNSRLVTKALSREEVVSFLQLAVPDPLLRALRKRLELAGARKEVPSVYERHSPEDIRLAEECFAEDRLAVNALFASHGIQSGSGAPFP